MMVFTYLYNLVQEILNCLEVPGLDVFYERFLQRVIIWLGKLDSREQIRDNALKQWNVVGQELEIWQFKIFIAKTSHITYSSIIKQGF